MATLDDNVTIGFVPWWKGDWRYWFYFIAHSVGGAGLTLLLLTMCLPLRRVRRNPILISMCLSWWLGSFPNTTLLFFTNNVLGKPPSQATCLASAALVMAQTPLNAVCAVMLVYNVWSVLYFNSARSTSSPVRTFFLVTIPYVVFFTCAGVVLAVGLIRPELVGRATFYCVVKSNVLMTFLGIFGGLCCIVAIALELWIAVLLRQNRNRNHNSPSTKSSASSGIDVQLAVRVILFGFYIFVGLALSGVSIVNWTSVVPDLCFSTFSIAVFAIFGSQKDILRVWRKLFCCCLIKDEQESRRSQSHIRTSSVEPGCKGGFDSRQGHNPYWHRGADRKNEKNADLMTDLATLRTRNTTTQAGTIGRSPYNSHSDFQFQYESDVGLGLVGNAQGQPTTAAYDDQKAKKKSRDNWWANVKNSGRPGTAGSGKRPGTAGSNFGETSTSWYPDLGYDFAPEGTSYTHDIELEQDVADRTMGAQDDASRFPTNGKNPKGHANPHTRHSSATVPSEYIGTSPRSPQFIYYEQEAGMQPFTQLTSPFVSSPTPLLSKAPSSKKENRMGGFMFPPVGSTDATRAPAANSRIQIEHNVTDSTETAPSVTGPSDPRDHLGIMGDDARYRESTDGLPDYYFRQHSHTYMHSTDYRSSADSSIGGGARAAIKTGNTTLYDSNYPQAYGYTHSNLSTTQVYAPPPKSAFDRENTGFEFISGRKRTGASSPDSFLTNPSLYGGRGGY